MKRSTVFWMVGMIAAAGITAAVAIGALVFFTLRQSGQPPTEAEKTLVVTAPRLAEFGANAVSAKGESYKVTRHIVGTRQIEYEYHSSRDPDAGETLMVISGAEINRSALDAVQSFHLTVAAMKGGTMIGGKGRTKLEAAPALLPLGDQRYAAYLVNAHGKAGNIFVVRNGRVLHSLILTGLYFDNPDEVRDLFQPIFERASREYGSP